MQKRWTWSRTRWIVAILCYGALCALGLFLDLSPDAGPDIGMGTILPAAGAICVVVMGLFTDRSWGVVKRLVYVVAVLLLWSVWSIASLFLVGLIGPALGFAPVAPGRMLLVFDVVYEVSFVPFVLVALWRSRLFVTARGVSESTVEKPY